MSNPPQAIAFVRHGNSGEQTMTERDDTFTDATSAAADGFTRLFGETGIGERLRAVGIPLTLQRLAIAHVMLAAPVHLTAEEVLTRVRPLMPEVSRATVYNALKLFKEKGLVRDIVVPDHVVFDSTTEPHHHFYDVDTGAVTDVPAGDIEVVGTANPPPGFDIEDIDVVVRVRRSKATP